MAKARLIYLVLVISSLVALFMAAVGPTALGMSDGGGW
jgi:hypothetical protein